MAITQVGDEASYLMGQITFSKSDVFEEGFYLMLGDKIVIYDRSSTDVRSDLDCEIWALQKLVLNRKDTFAGGAVKKVTVGE